jgi:hypothetical protein
MNAESPSQENGVNPFGIQGWAIRRVEVEQRFSLQEILVKWASRALFKDPLVGNLGLRVTHHDALPSLSSS